VLYLRTCRRAPKRNCSYLLLEFVPGCKRSLLLPPAHSISNIKTIGSGRGSKENFDPARRRIARSAPRQQLPERLAC
jgi:hypothetical protein